MNHREQWDEQHYAFKRNSGLRREDFAETNGRWDIAVFIIAVAIGVITYLGVGFLGWCK
jgi:hypothetical protein